MPQKTKRGHGKAKGGGTETALPRRAAKLAFKKQRRPGFDGVFAHKRHKQHQSNQQDRTPRQTGRLMCTVFVGVRDNRIARFKCEKTQHQDDPTHERQDLRDAPAGLSQRRHKQRCSPETQGKHRVIEVHEVQAMALFKLRNPQVGVDVEAGHGHAKRNHHREKQGG